MKKHPLNYILIEEVRINILKKKTKIKTIYLIDCFLEKGQIIFAIQDYEQALEITPNNNEIKLRISNVYFNNAERQYKEKLYQV
jgi:tetratricopeptide (TPR) repeat protein